jgi:hypothetical protein
MYPKREIDKIAKLVGFYLLRNVFEKLGLRCLIMPFARLIA